MANVPGALDGLIIVVTRAKSQASVLTERLVGLGAVVRGVATIEIVAPLDGGAALDSALAVAHTYDQIVVASPNGARALVEAVERSIAQHGMSAESLPPVACVGPSTAAKLADSPLRVNLTPDRAVAEGLVGAMPDGVPGKNRLLLVQAEVARDTLERGLGEKGWQIDRVTAYRTVDAAIADADRASAGSGDVVTFTSSSTVERFVRLIGLDVVPPVVASIGPVTSATARELGVEVTIEADPHTIDGLVDALIVWSTTR